MLKHSLTVGAPAGLSVRASFLPRFRTAAIGLAMDDLGDMVIQGVMIGKL